MSRMIITNYPHGRCTSRAVVNSSSSSQIQVQHTMVPSETNPNGLIAIPSALLQKLEPAVELSVTSFLAIPRPRVFSMSKAVKDVLSWHT